MAYQMEQRKVTQFKVHALLLLKIGKCSLRNAPEVVAVAQHIDFLNEWYEDQRTKKSWQKDGKGPFLFHKAGSKIIGYNCLEWGKTEEWWITIEDLHRLLKPHPDIVVIGDSLQSFLYIEKEKDKKTKTCKITT